MIAGLVRVSGETGGGDRVEDRGRAQSAVD